MDRDLIVFRVFETGASRLEAESLASEEADQLRRRFGVTSGQFAVILIGKDGGVKLLQKRQADLQEIFNRIDSMPMRQQEMREKRQNK